VTIEEVEDVVFGVADEDPDFDVRRDGPNYVVLGETGNGRLLTIALEPISSGYFRPFAARDMEPHERRTYRNRRKRRR
jgi:uncharacterized DUF497 family protein